MFQIIDNRTSLPDPIDPPPGDWRLGTAVVVFRHNPEGQVEVLLGQRKGAHGEGTFAFPGGKTDGQGLYEAALRELKEETDLDGIPIAYLGDVYREFEAVQRWRTMYVLVEARGTLRTCEPDKNEGWAWHNLAVLPSPWFAPAALFVESGRLALAASDWEQFQSRSGK